MRRADLVALRSLSAQEWRWLIAASALLPVVAASVRLGGYQRTMRRFARIAGRAGTHGDPPAIARMVRIAATYGPYRAQCLPRALVLWTLLRRHGHAPVISFGVRRDHTRLDAHAWVELGAERFDDAPEPATFARFERRSKGRGPVVA